MKCILFHKDVEKVKHKKKYNKHYITIIVIYFIIITYTLSSIKTSKHAHFLSIITPLAEKKATPCLSCQLFIGPLLKLHTHTKNTKDT